jgi:transposase
MLCNLQKIKELINIINKKLYIWAVEYIFITIFLQFFYILKNIKKNKFNKIQINLNLYFFIILLLMNINNLNKRLINLYLRKINYGNKTINKGRPDKEELNHYIDVIFKVIKTAIPWRALHEKLHFSTYHKKFVKWNNLNIFENIHKLLNTRDILFDGDKDLYIDSTMCKNINGSEYVGPNHYDRNRNGNKISLVVTKKGIPNGLKLAPSNEHDIGLVEDTTDNISVKIVGSRIGGDKGYVSNDLRNKLKK